MPANPVTAHSDDRFRYCLTLTASAQRNGECGRVVRVSRRSSSLSLIRGIRHRARGRLRDRTCNLAPSISLPRIIAEGAGS